MKKFLVVLFWFFSLIIVIIYTYENPERFNVIKDHFMKKTASGVKLRMVQLKKLKLIHLVWNLQILF